jgi:hypothetical protein
MYLGLRVKFLTCSTIITRLEFSRQIIIKVLNNKFHENPSFGRRVVPCGRTDTTKLVVTFPNYADAVVISASILSAASSVITTEQ